MDHFNLRFLAYIFERFNLQLDHYSLSDTPHYTWVMCFKIKSSIKLWIIT